MPQDTQIIYPRPIRLLHWVLAFLMIGMVALGWYMTSLGKEQHPTWNLYSLHKSIGVTIVALALWRLWFRFTRTLPGRPQGTSDMEYLLARTTYFLFYVFMLSIPLVGYLMSNAFDHGVSWFGVPLPRLIAPDKAFGGLLAEIHEWSAYIMLGFVGLHLAGVIKHLVIDKQNLLKRMWG